MFRYHDCLHNLWALPTDKKRYVEIQVAGEIVVLLLSECFHSKMMYDLAEDDEIKTILARKEGMWLHDTFLKNRSKKESANLLYDVFFNDKNVETACDKTSKFLSYFKPMLNQDMQHSQHNLKLLSGWHFSLHEQIPLADYKDGNLIDQFLDNFDDLLTGSDRLLYIPSTRRTNNLPEGWL